MGFFDSLGKIAAERLEKAVEQQAKINEIKGRYSHYSDSKLIEKFKAESGDHKLAIGMLLKDRGYFKKS